MMRHVFNISIYIGLQCLKERGLQHRDVKPGNLMVLDAVGDGQVTGLIIDLGSAQSIGESLLYYTIIYYLMMCILSYLYRHYYE